MSSQIKEMEIADYNILQNISAAFYRLWKLKLIVVLATVMGALLAIFYVTLVGDTFNYSSSATIYSAVYGSQKESDAGVPVMNTYSGIMNSSRVCERAAAEIDDSTVTAKYLQSLVGSGKVSLVGASTSSKSFGYKLSVVTRLDTPDNVVAITNAMANAFASEVNELMGDDVIQVYDKASSIYASKVISRKLLVIIVAGVTFVLAAAIIFIKEFFSSRVYTIAQCEKDKDLILGVLPFIK